MTESEDDMYINEATRHAPLWTHKAIRNVEKWGLQDPWTILAATFEELAEVGEELSSHVDPNAKNVQKTNDVVDLDLSVHEAIQAGKRIQEVHEATYEDEHGNPVENPPTFDYDGENVDRIADEIRDTAALLFQLQAAIRRDE